jgi:hypothetical protein
MLSSRSSVCLWALLLVVSAAASAPRPSAAYSLLPLVTEEAQTLPSGWIEGTLAIDYFHNARYPPFTPPGIIKSQTLIALPQISFHIGVGTWAEFQASYELWYLDETAFDGDTNHQYGGGDTRIFTKLWFARERTWLPAIGMRFGTKLPNAKRPDGLGTDDTDFAATALLSKTLGPVTAHANMGISLLGNSGPIFGNSFGAGGQDDLFTYSLGVASKPLGAIAEGAMTLQLLGEIDGQTGSRYDNDFSNIRGGLRLQRGAGTLFLGVSAGLGGIAAEVGASGGFTYTFDSATLFPATD